MRRIKSTFSIVVADVGAGEVGVAVQSRYFAVGNVVPWARAGVGAVATQAAGVAAFGPAALDLLASGMSPEDALAGVLADDEARETRQVAVVAADGRGAVHTGAECSGWAGHRVGDGYAVLGNILAGHAVVAAMEQSFLDAAGTLAERLVASLEAGQAAGGDVRGQQSAAVVVERVGAARESREGVDRVCDLRVDDHPEPIVELRRLLGIHRTWDALRRATRFHAPGRYADGAALLRATLAEAGEKTELLLYDLACFETLSGDTTSALEHLRRALELDPALRGSAREDPDLIALRGTDAFASLVV